VYRRWAILEKALKEIKMLYMDNSDTTAQSRRVIADIYRQMPLDAKVRRIFDAYEMGRQLTLAGLRLAHPQLGRHELWRLWAKRHLGPKLFEKVYGASDDE